MDGILNHDSPRDSPMSRAAERQANNTLLSKRRAQQQVAIMRARLIESIKNAEEEIAEEKAHKKRLAAQAKDIRQQMERLATVATDLEKEKARQEAHVHQRESDIEKRRQPLSTKLGDGMLTFQRIGCEKYPPERKGPSFGRTAFVFDYSGRVYLAGSGERKSETQMYKHAMKEVERRRAEARALEEEKRRQSNTSTLSATALPPLNTSAGNTANGTEGPSIIKQKRLSTGMHAPIGGTGAGSGGYPYNKNTVYGKPSSIDLEKYKHLSSKRSRYYTDYEGRRIAMDPSDWPSPNGLLLL